jgi:hypothetical protein
LKTPLRIELLNNFRNHADSIEKTIDLEDLIACLFLKSNITHAIDNVMRSDRGNL